VIEIPEASITPLHEVVPEPAAADVLYRPGMTMAEVEKATIQAALKESRGNRRQAAVRLGIGERTLYRKIKEFALG
jgi:DNA-binding NtrC family response regulator